MSGSAKKRVCVIGCGPSGMSMLLQLGKLSDAEIPDIVCYEKQDTVGGLWNVTWGTGIFQYTLRQHAHTIYCNIHGCKNDYFQIKIIISFIFLLKT